MFNPQEFYVNFNFEGFNYDIHLIKDEKAIQSVRINGLKYAVLGDEDRLQKACEILNSLPLDSISNVEDLSGRLSSLKGISLPTQRIVGFGVESLNPSAQLESTNEKINTTVKIIQQGNGSIQAIRKQFKKLKAEGISPEGMMAVAVALAKSGNIIKASHFFFLIQLTMDNDARMRSMGEIGIAFLEYGTEHNDPIALDFALMHLSNAEHAIQAKNQLSKISLNANNPLQQAQAEMALKRNAIFNVLNSISDVCNTDKALEDIKSHSSDAKEAFEQAKALQSLIDSGKSLLMTPPGQFVEIIDQNNNPLIFHVNLSGQRVHPEDPIIIFEAGLGCFSADWHLVQQILPHNEMLSMSYDRAGMGWSSPDNSSPTIERTVENLNAILKKLNLAPPYIFVGHSYGGMIGQLFALKHPPEEIRGLILVDSGIEEVKPSLGEDRPRIKRAIDYLPRGVSDFISNKRAHEVGDQLALQMHYAVAKTSHIETTQKELKEYESNGAVLTQILQQNSKEYPLECHVKVITATHYLNLDEDRPLDENEQKISDLWQEGQRKLLKRAAKSSQIIAEESDHMILHHQPELIAEQIQDLFQQYK